MSFVVNNPHAYKDALLTRQNHRCARCGDWLVLKDARFISGLPQELGEIEAAELAHRNCC